MEASRRGFAAATAAALAGLALPAAAAPRQRKPLPMKLIKPPRLHQGDLVGLIAPGGFTKDDAIDKATRKIEGLGFRVREGRHLRKVWGNYAGTVEERLEDLHAMFADPEIKAIWCIRGGSGCISLLARLDYDLVRKNPKVLIGYSDVTALHLALLKKVGLVTFHGPVAMAGHSDYAMSHLMAVLCDPQPRYVIPQAAENAERALSETHYAIRTVHGGVATGPLIGGNLSLVAALAGTPYAADLKNAIIFLEEVNEAPYRIDRWMTQLDLSSPFAQAAAMMVGICDNCGPGEEESSLSLDETLDIHLAPMRGPAVSGYSFGHIRHQFTIPVGIRATLDADAQTLTLLEPAVS
jgi:muramoyltetrapeptide carboxypeptidase